MSDYDLNTIIEKIKETQADWELDSRSWEKRILTINLTWLSNCAAETYLNLLKRIYLVTGNGNPVRDLIFHIAAQRLLYRSIPWSDPFRASMIQIDGSQESSLIVAGAKNNRVNFIFVPSFAPSGVSILIEHINTLHENYNKLNGYSFSLQNLQNLQNLQKISLVHICDQPSLESYINIWSLISSKFIDGGVAIFSGSRKIVCSLKDTLQPTLSDWDIQYIDTVRIDKDKPDRLDSVLILVSPSFNKSKISLGDPQKNAMEELKKNSLIIPNLDYFRKVRNFSTLADSTLIDISDSKIQMKSKCIGVVGYHNLTSIHDRINFLSNRNSESNFFTQPFGQYVCFEPGRIINNLPMDSLGRAPFQATQHVSRSLTDPNNWIFGTRSIGPKSIKLKGLWFRMPSSSTGFSHWFMESFLPLLAAQEFGIKFNLITHEPLKQYAQLYLQLIGISPTEVVTMESNLSYECEMLITPINKDLENDPMSLIRVHHPVVMQGINRLLNNAGISNRHQTEKIYISRSDANNYRQIINEEEVSKLLALRGYKELNSSKISTLESLKIYSCAKTIVAPLGAGLINSIFSLPNTNIISFQSRTYYEPFLEQIAHLAGHNYAVLGCDHFNAEDYFEGGARNTNYFVDLEKLDVMLDLIENVYH